MFIIIFVIDTNAFLKDEFNTLLPNAMAKVNQFGRSTRSSGYKLLHTTKVLIISVFIPLLHHGFI